MKKYRAIFSATLQNELAYRLNFLMWRVRNVLQIFLIFFLWDSVFSDSNRILFGYDKAKILTYIFGVFVLRSLVLSSKAQDIAGEIARGDLSNYLLKPINYFKYWFTRDISTKTLNVGFALIEALILYFVLKPTFLLPPTVLHLLLFIVSLCIGVVLFFFLQAIFASFTFWFIEQSWGFNYLLLIFTELLGGILFPLDILPLTLQKFIYLTPFAYLVFTPLQIYLGKFDVVTSANAIVMSLVWLILLSVVLQKMWSLGVKNYRAEGR